MQVEKSFELHMHCLLLVRLHGYSLDEIGQRFCVGKRRMLKFLRDYDKGKYSDIYR
jgi:hypothetical protein